MIATTYINFVALLLTADIVGRRIRLLRKRIPKSLGVYLLINNVILIIDAVDPN